MDRNKILKMVVILAAIAVIAGSISKFIHRDSLTLTEYADLHSTTPPSESSQASESSSSEGSQASEPSSSEGSQASKSPSSESSQASESPSSESSQASEPFSSEGSQPLEPPSSESSQASEAPSSENSQASEPPSLEGPSAPDPSSDDARPVGVTLNGSSMEKERVALNDDFYYEPLSDKLMRYMAGNSYPGKDALQDADPEIGYEELRYVHILHYDFEGVSREGELICNEYIAQDLTEIFYELYRNEYRLERVLLIDEYQGDDNASMEDNNTSCFNYRPVTNSANLSMHAYGLAVDINPLYNPYVAYKKDGSQEILPASAQPYADRSQSFPYKIDEDDFCYKLFMNRGFTWGGNWNNLKDYQHFQKSKP